MFTTETVNWTTFGFVFISILLPIVLAWARSRWRSTQAAVQDYYDAHTTEVQRATIEHVVCAAVVAAEQSGLSKLIANVGQVKKNYALDFAQSYLKAHGIPIDLHLLDRLIEASVYEQFHSEGGTTATISTPDSSSVVTATAVPTTVSE